MTGGLNGGLLIRPASIGGGDNEADRIGLLGGSGGGGGNVGVGGNLLSRLLLVSGCVETMLRCGFELRGDSP